jgi:hypothetical protein
MGRLGAWRRCSEVEGLAYAEYFRLKTSKGEEREAPLETLLEMTCGSGATLRGPP